MHSLYLSTGSLKLTCFGVIHAAMTCHLNKQILRVRNLNYGHYQNYQKQKTVTQNEYYM